MVSTVSEVTGLDVRVSLCKAILVQMLLRFGSLVMHHFVWDHDPRIAALLASMHKRFLLFLLCALEQADIIVLVDHAFSAEFQVQELFAVECWLHGVNITYLIKNNITLFK